MLMHTLNVAYESLQDIKKTKPFDYYFEQIQSLLLEAVNQQHVTLIEDLLQQHFLQLVNTNSSIDVFFLLKKLEAFFTSQVHHLLPLYYQILGHLLYYRQEQDKANYYYRLAISHSVEQKDYIALASAMTHFTSKVFYTMPKDVGQTIAKSIPLLFKLAPTYKKEDFLATLYFHIEFAILHHQAHSIEPLLQNIIRKRVIQPDSRYGLQLKILQGLLWQAKNEQSLAKAQLLEVLTYCVQHHVHDDLLIRVYKELSLLGAASLDETIHEKVLQREQQLQTERNQLVDYLEESQALQSLLFNHIFGMPPDQFKVLGNTYLTNTAHAGHTLILIDCLLVLPKAEGLLKSLVSPASEEMLDVLTLFNEAMTERFGEYILATTLLSDMAVAYIVPLSKRDVCLYMEDVIEQVRHVYPAQHSILKTISYAAVNNKENNLQSAEDCLYLAYAHIYYELQ